MIQDYFKLALKNLQKRKLRSWLTILGIFIAVATIVILISLSLGLQGAIKEQFNILGGDKFFILPKGQLGAPGTGGAVQLTTDDVNAVKKASGVKDVAYAVIGNAQIEFNNIKRYYFVAAIPEKDLPLFESATSLKVDEGKDLKDAKLDEVALGSLYKTGNLFGKPIRAGDKILVNGKEVKVVAIMQSVGNAQDDQNVYMFIDTYAEIYGSTNRADEIIVQVNTGANVTDVADRVKQKLMKFRNEKESTIDFTVLTPEELLTSFSTILNIITVFLSGIAAISLLVGGIGIANTMYTSVLERTQEIGTMKAVGAKNRDILLIFLIESGMLGLVGGLIGIILGYIVGKSIGYYASVALGTNLLQASFPWYLILGALLFGFGIGSLAGLLPARQASKLSPTEALRYE